MRPTLSPWSPHAPRISHPYLGKYEPSPVAVALGDPFSFGLFAGDIPLAKQAVAVAVGRSDWTPEEQRALLKALGAAMVEQGFADSAGLDGQELYGKAGLSSFVLKTYGSTGNVVDARTGASFRYSTTPGDKTYPYVDVSKIKATVLESRPAPTNPINPNTVDVPSSSVRAEVQTGGEQAPPPGDVLGARGEDSGLPSWVPHGMTSVPDLLKWIVLIGLFGVGMYAVNFATKD